MPLIPAAFFHPHFIFRLILFFLLLPKPPKTKTKKRMHTALRELVADYALEKPRLRKSAQVCAGSFLPVLMHTALRELVADYALKEPRLRRRPGKWHLPEDFTSDCARKGLSKVLQWARKEQKCRLQKQMQQMQKQMQQMQKQMQKQMKTDWEATDKRLKALEDKSLEMLQWLQKEGCPAPLKPSLPPVSALSISKSSSL